MENQQYPRLINRMKAIVTDSVAVLLSILIVTYFFTLFENVGDNLKMIAAIAIFVLYDPLTTSFWGGTIGHMLNGICVRNSSDNKRYLSLPLAFLRFFVKSTLGIISLFTITGNGRHRAIHDIFSGSIVLYREGK